MGNLVTQEHLLHCAQCRCNGNGLKIDRNLFNISTHLFEGSHLQRFPPFQCPALLWVRSIANFSC